MKRISLIIALTLVVADVQASSTQEIIDVAHRFDADLDAIVSSYVHECLGLANDEQSTDQIKTIKKITFGNIMTTIQSFAPELSACSSEDLTHTQAFATCLREMSLKSFEAGACLNPIVQTKNACPQLTQVSDGCKSAFTALLSSHKDEL